MPTRIFEKESFKQFKKGMNSTMQKFRSINQSGQARSTSADENKRVTKRKRATQEEEHSDTFNPKYLTSRDLFDLEVCLYGPYGFT